MLSPRAPTPARPLTPPPARLAIPTGEGPASVRVIALDQTQALERKRMMRSWAGGWVENRFAIARPRNGLTM